MTGALLYGLHAAFQAFAHGVAALLSFASHHPRAR
jgi:hypothetical protein